MSSQLTRGGLVNGAPVRLTIQESYDEYFPEWSSITFYCSVYLLPQEFSNGVSFSAYAFDGAFPGSEGYPDFTERQLWVGDSEIYDRRAGYYGLIECSGLPMTIGSSVPPTVSPALSILDSSIFEGDRGKSQLKLGVTLSGASNQTITVSYQTKSGTAATKSDYIAASGTLTFSPGETQKSISVSIVGDRKREPDETFTVQLSNPSGAKLFDSTATATILNDD